MCKIARRAKATGGVSRRGFTLLEVMVALAVGAFVLTGAWTLVVSVSDAADQVTRESEAADREANDIELIRGLVRRTEVDIRSTLVFRGGPDSASFASWCDVPQGWSERCLVTLMPVRTSGMTTLHLRTSSGLYLTMQGRPAVGGLVFLDQSVEPREWRKHWDSATARPSAVGLVRERDTLLLAIGG